jgi:hypothetical protein
MQANPDNIASGRQERKAVLVMGEKVSVADGSLRRKERVSHSLRKLY